jgi:sugar/nucleoside kinase (ribokinase family)
VGYAFLAEPQASAARQAASVAHESGVALSLDPSLTGPPAVLEELRGLLGRLAAVLPNRAEAIHLSGEVEPQRALAALAARCPGTVAIKLDAAGCLLSRGGEVVALAAFPVLLAGPTGAGDAFGAALLAGLLDGVDLEALAVLGNASGAMTAMRKGAGGAVPTTAELARFLAQQEGLMPAGHKAVQRARGVLERWLAPAAPVAADTKPV